MLDITRGVGFRMTFANGYTLSVQFGAGHYCGNRNMPFGAPPDADGFHSCPNAEVAVLTPTGKFMKLGENDDVIGYQTANDIAALIATVSAYIRVDA